MAGRGRTDGRRKNKLKTSLYLEKEEEENRREKNARPVNKLCRAGWSCWTIAMGKKVGLESPECFWHKPTRNFYLVLPAFCCCIGLRGRESSVVFVHLSQCQGGEEGRLQWGFNPPLFYIRT